jgi:hypothetical protein
MSEDEAGCLTDRSTVAPAASPSQKSYDRRPITIAPTPAIISSSNAPSAADRAPKEFSAERDQPHAAIGLDNGAGEVAVRRSQ